MQWEVNEAWVKYCVCTVGGNQPAALSLSPPAGRQVSQRLAEEAKKRERFEELRQHLEQEQEVGQRVRKGDQWRGLHFTPQLSPF